MNVAIIGSGGREHALALQISKSKLLDQLYNLPGNPGMEKLGTNIDINVGEHEEILKFCVDKNIDLVVIGPEIPLVNGLSDLLRKNSIRVFGPSKVAAEIEGNKSFSKELMRKYNIPTAEYEIFKVSEYEKALSYLDTCNYPIVLKASGLAAGKGVLICEDKDSAQKGLKEIMLDKAFGEAGNEVVIEEFMVGLEASIFAITDGKDFVCLPAAQDHKRALDGDKGLNTGGMGAYSPAPLISEELLTIISNKIISPTINAMASEGKTYSGCLYAGLMITKSGPKVVEFNCRFGDPETQVVLPLLNGDLLELLDSSARGKINKNSVSYGGGSAVCVVAASKGYPGAYQKGYEILGLDDVDNEIIIYHAGTKRHNNKIVTNGGRVLGVTALSKTNNLSVCKTMAYDALSKVNFDGIYYRKDISDKANMNIN